MPANSQTETPASAELKGHTSVELTGTPKRIVLLEPDPFLAYLIRLDLPSADVIEMDPEDDIEDVLSEGIDLLVIDLKSPRVAEARRVNVPKIGIVEGSQSVRTGVAAHVDGVLIRPFVPAELYSLVRKQLRLKESPQSRTAPSLVKAQRLLGGARVLAVALAAVFEVAQSPSTQKSFVFAVAALYVGIRLIPSPDSQGGAWADIIFATALVAATGGLTSNYVTYGFVAALGGGLILGKRPGIIGGFLVSTGSMQSILERWQDGDDPRQLIAWMLLFPAAALIGNLAARVWRVGTGRADLVLAEANRVLSTLHRLARTMPGGLEERSVAATALREMRETMGATAGAVVLAEAEVVGVPGTFGLHGPAEMVLHRKAGQIIDSVDGRAGPVPVEILPAEFKKALAAKDIWLAAPLRHGGVQFGALLAAIKSAGQQESLLFLEHLAAEVSVQLENARLFSRVRELSVDEERYRIADELHDGVAQLLTHVRMELDMLSRRGSNGKADEQLQHLSSVVERTLGEVRSTILGLRSTLSREGLVGSLRSYIANVNSLGGPPVVFSAKGATALDRRTEAEVFRIVQEAVAWALRQAETEEVSVMLESTPVTTIITLDQKVGSGESEGTKRWRLKAVEDRVERLGGKVLTAANTTGGCRVKVTIEPRPARGNPVRT